MALSTGRIERSDVVDLGGDESGPGSVEGTGTGVGSDDLFRAGNRLRQVERGGTLQRATSTRPPPFGVLVAQAGDAALDDEPLDPELEALLQESEVGREREERGLSDLVDTAALSPELSFGQALALDFAYAAGTSNLTLEVLNRVAELGDEGRVVSYLEGETLALYKYDRHQLNGRLAKYKAGMSERQKAVCLIFLLVHNETDLGAISSVVDRHVDMVERLRFVRTKRSVSLGEAVVLQYGPWLKMDAQGNPVPALAPLERDLVGMDDKEVARYVEDKAKGFASQDVPGRGAWDMPGQKQDPVTRVVASMRRIMVALGYSFAGETSTSASSVAILSRLTGRLSTANDEAMGAASYAHLEGPRRSSRRAEPPPVEGDKGVRPAAPDEESPEVAELLDELTTETAGDDWKLIAKARSNEPLSAGEAVYLYLGSTDLSSGESLLHLVSVKALERMDQVLAYLQSELMKVFRQDEEAVDRLLEPFGTPEQKVVASFILLKGADNLDGMKDVISYYGILLRDLRTDSVLRPLADVVYAYIGHELEWSSDNRTQSEFRDLEDSLRGKTDEQVADYLVLKAAGILGVEKGVLEQALLTSRGRMSPAERAMYSIYLVLTPASDPRTRSDLSIALQSAIVERLTGQTFQLPVVDRDELEALALAVRGQSISWSGPRRIEDLYREIGFDVVQRERAHRTGTFVECLRIYLAVAAGRNPLRYERLALELRVLDEFLKTRPWEFPDRQRLCLDFVRAYMGQGNGGQASAEEGLSASAFLEQRWKEGEERRQVTETIRNAVREVERQERERVREERTRRKKTKRG